MKVTFALTLLLSCLSGLLMATEDDEAVKILESCISENSVSTQDLMDLKSGKLKPEDAKDNLKCATQCALVKFGFMNDKGKLLNDKILSIFTDASIRSKVEKALSECGDVSGANPCDKAFQMMLCFEKFGGEMINF